MNEAKIIAAILASHAESSTDQEVVNRYHRLFALLNQRDKDHIPAALEPLYEEALKHK